MSRHPHHSISVIKFSIYHIYLSIFDANIFFIENLVKEKGFDLRQGHKGKVVSVCSFATGINIDSTHLTHKPVLVCI